MLRSEQGKVVDWDAGGWEGVWRRWKVMGNDQGTALVGVEGCWRAMGGGGR